MSAVGQHEGQRERAASATGKGVRVAVIDSGINPHHSHVGRVEGGIHFFRRSDGTLASDETWFDILGHGTAIAGIIRAKAPDVDLYSIRVFDRFLECDADVIAAAIRWAADRGLDIANCSLGTDDPRVRHHLESACNYAERLGMLVVACCGDTARQVLPACLPNVVAAIGDERCGWDRYVPDASRPGVFRAHPQPQPLPRLHQGRNLRGHSFASGHVTAAAARLREEYRKASFETMVRLLKENSIVAA